MKKIILLALLAISTLTLQAQMVESAGDSKITGKLYIAPSGTTPDLGYNGSLMITKPSASGQYINLVRQGLMQWSIGTVYSSNTFAIGQGTSSDASFSNPFFNITNTGNVGIGITIPGAKLDVAGEIKMQGRIGMYINDTTQCFKYDTNKIMGHYSLGWFNDSWCSTSGPALWMSGFGGVKFFTGGTPRMVIDNSGKVGIGTTIPDQALTVKGKIHAEEVIVDLAVPADYVFKSSYKLMPLNQVEQYVNANSHLPEIPSADEITKNGMSMGEMQNKLLQKVEELTLYMIEQQKTINQQSVQINQQSEKIEELEKKLQ